MLPSFDPPPAKTYTMKLEESRHLFNRDIAKNAEQLMAVNQVRNKIRTSQNCFN